MTTAHRSGDRAAISTGTARTLAAGVFIVVDVTLIVLWLAVMRTSPELTGLLVASIVTLAVGLCCLVAVLVLGLRWRRPISSTRPNRSTTTTVLSAVSVLQLVGGFTALLVLGAFASGNGLAVLGATLLASVVVAGLGISVGRHVARTAVGEHG